MRADSLAPPPRVRCEMLTLAQELIDRQTDERQAERRFALDYLNRTHGLILYSSAMPFPDRPPTYSKRQGPPSFLMNDYLMYLLSPLFGPVMGMSNAIVNQMMPISERKAGALLDTTVSNLDMARNFDDYAGRGDC